MQSYLKWFGAVSVLILFAGCAAKNEQVAPPFPKTPQKNIVQKEQYKVPGSLYTGYDNLFSDAKAYNVGDVLTILVNEVVTGKGSTNTKSSRVNKMDLSIPTPTIMDKKLPKGKSSVFGLNQASTNSFQGKGGTDRSAKLIAKITARVVKVYPNGNLYIVGKKYIKINNDTQYIKISGIVNPMYINPDDTIDSSKISDMYVEYNGKGFLNTTQRPGWLADFIMKIWPF